MTFSEIKTDLKYKLTGCWHPNDGSLAGHVNQSIQWAWNNWPDGQLAPHYSGDKPETYTHSFMEEWVDNQSDYIVNLNYLK